MYIIRYLIRFFKYSKRELINIIRLIDIDMNKKFEAQRLKSKSIKMCHSLEKGLSLKNPRPGFGISKVESILSNLELYKRNRYDMNDDAIGIIYGVLSNYIEFQGRNNIDITEIVSKFNVIFDRSSINNLNNQGGALHISDTNITNEEKESFIKLINTRHSVRDYTEENISLEKIRESVTLALRSPSACNRQPSRVYVIDKEHRKKLIEFLEGSGGFENDANKYLIVTSDISAFELREKNQWLVSTGIFIGYLSLALHANGIGACIVERNLEFNAKNKEFARMFGIPEEEQIVCAISLGKYPSEFNVPVSKRYKLNHILKEIN